MKIKAGAAFQKWRRDIVSTCRPELNLQPLQSLQRFSSSIRWVSQFRTFFPSQLRDNRTQNRLNLLFQYCVASEPGAIVLNEDRSMRRNQAIEASGCVSPTFKIDMVNRSMLAVIVPRGCELHGA